MKGITELIQIVGKVLNIHEEPINNENAVIELTMKELLEICNNFMIKWIPTSEKIPNDVENYLVYGDGMYDVTFYSHRRKKWNVDFNVEYYTKLPKIHY